MPAQALASHLEATASTVTSPFHFLAVVFNLLASLAAPLIDTPAERAAIEGVVMGAYDKLVVSMATTNPALAGIFLAFRKYVSDSLDAILLSLVPPPAPTPSPAPVVLPIPTGAHA